MCRMHANGGAMNRKRLSVSDGALPQSASAREFKKGPKRRPRHCVKKRNRARLFAPAQAVLESRVRQNPSQRASRQRGARFRLSKNPRRAREGRSPFELSIVPSGVYGGHGTVFVNLIFQRKNRFLAVSAPEKSLIFSGDW